MHIYPQSTPNGSLPLQHNKTFNVIIHKKKMRCCFFFTLLLSLLSPAANVASSHNHIAAAEIARDALQRAVSWAERYKILSGPDQDSDVSHQALVDCVKMYKEAEPRLSRLVSGKNAVADDDGVTWLSAALASHTTCIDGLKEKGVRMFEPERARNLTRVIREALKVYGARSNSRKKIKRKSNFVRRYGFNDTKGLLSSGDLTTVLADIVVAQDGSGNCATINDAMAALAQMGHNRPDRFVVYVKSGVYNEKVEIEGNMYNVAFIGDGVDKTIVTGNRNVQDGETTLNSATFGVSGDGFWARDMTFENTAGPEKHQAVAMRVSSDRSVFYRCSFKGFQDTLYVHSLRQFYRECQIYGTVDFIFGDAVAVLQQCDIFVRRPMDNQVNMITAQGRRDPNENTGISILNSRVVPSSEFSDVKGDFKSYLGRPWKEYSRTVFCKTDLDGLVDGRGWEEWSGDFALSTLYYGEYMNTGDGASTGGRVNWAGFHAMSDPDEASKFAVKNFIGGEDWIPATGVPFWVDL